MIIFKEHLPLYQQEKGSYLSFGQRGKSAKFENDYSYYRKVQKLQENQRFKEGDLKFRGRKEFNILNWG